MTLPTYLIEALTEFCIECDDVFQDEISEDGVNSCRGMSHHRALDPERDMEWKICDRCRGEGFLRGWAGAYTESDRAEWSDDDYEDYATTKRACEDCGGTGKVRDFTEAAYERPIVRAWLKDHYESEAISAQERRMGA
jgi:hypothetical protein